MKKIIIGLLFTVIYGCTLDKNNNFENLCREFYELNKDKDMSFLLNYQILNNRTYSIYNDSLGRYDIITPVITRLSDNDSLLILPSYPPSSDIETRKIFYNRAGCNTLNYISEKYNISLQSDSLFKYYQVEIDSIYSEYQKIEIPKELPYNNIPVIGNKAYIDFKLKDSYEGSPSFYRCFYISDTIIFEKNLTIYNLYYIWMIGGVTKKENNK